MGTYRISTSRKRPVQDRCPRTPPAQPGPRGTALPLKTGKEAENRFLFFHRVLGIYRPGRSGSFHPGHLERTGPRASPAQPGAFLGWVNLPCARFWSGSGVGRGAELREKRGFSPLGRGCALARQGQDQCKSILIDDAACDERDGVQAGNRTFISAMPAANWAHFSPWAAQPCPSPGGIFISSDRAQMTCTQASPTSWLRCVPSECPQEHLFSRIYLHRVPTLV